MKLHLIFPLVMFLLTSCGHTYTPKMNANYSKNYVVKKAKTTPTKVKVKTAKKTPGPVKDFDAFNDRVLLNWLESLDQKTAKKVAKAAVKKEEKTAKPAKLKVVKEKPKPKATPKKQPKPKAAPKTAKPKTVPKTAPKPKVALKEKPKPKAIPQKQPKPKALAQEPAKEEYKHSNKAIVLQAYDIRELSFYNAPGAFVENKLMLELITKVIAPQSWSNSRASININNGQLLIHQTKEVHKEIGQLLEDLKKARKFLHWEKVEQQFKKE